MKVYVVIEEWWDGRGYSCNADDDVFVYATMEEADAHKHSRQKDELVGECMVAVVEKEIE